MALRTRIPLRKLPRRAFPAQSRRRRQKSEARLRARDLGTRIGTFSTGPFNAITDVAGCRVGYTTLIEGEGPLIVGQGPVRTGVTVILAHGGDVWSGPVFAGHHRLNGNGEMTGLLWLGESGLLSGPVALTNTSSVGLVRDTLVRLEAEQRPGDHELGALPVVGETHDGILNDINGFHIRPEHVEAALRSAAGGPVAEGNVGGGTGMICHGFKAGTGTSSRRVCLSHGLVATVGVLVQANYGRRSRLRVDGVPVGRYIPETEVPDPRSATAGRDGAGSIVGVVATDAPLLPHQCDRLAQRAGLGVARTGGVADDSSGDIFLAFATGNRLLGEGRGPGHLVRAEMLPNEAMTPLFEAVVDATEEAIVNALLAATTMSGRDGNTAYALDPGRLEAVLAAHRPHFDN